MKHIKIKILTVALYSVIAGFLLGCTVISDITGIPLTNPPVYPETEEQRTKDAIEQYNNGQYQLAIDNYTAIIKYWDKRKYESKDLIYEEKMNTKTRSMALLFIARGDAYRRLNDFEKAEAEYSQSLSLIDNLLEERFSGHKAIEYTLHFESALAYARLYNDKNDYNSAIRVIDDFINYAHGYNFQDGHEYEYIDAAKKIAKPRVRQGMPTRVPNDWILYYQAHYYRGLYYYRMQEYEKAAEDFKIAVMTATARYYAINKIAGVDHKDDPWQIITDAAIKAEGSNPYVKIIRDVQYPIDMAIIRDDGLDLYRQGSVEREMICIAGKYSTQNRIRTESEFVSQRMTFQGMETTHRLYDVGGEIYYEDYDFLAGKIYRATERSLTIEE